MGFGIVAGAGVAMRPRSARIVGHVETDTVEPMHDVRAIPSDLAHPLNPLMRLHLSREFEHLGGGPVTLNVCVSRDGNVTEVKILDGLDERLDREIARAVRKWKYRPYYVDGQAVPFCTSVRFEQPPREAAPTRPVRRATAGDRLIAR
jgi:TonB family protein